MLRSSTSGQPQTALVPLSTSEPLCSKTRQKLSRLLDQCYLHNKVDTKAVRKLNQLVAQYAPELRQACTTSAAVTADKLTAAVALMNRVNKVILDNSLLDFVPLALGQLFNVLHGHKDMLELLKQQDGAKVAEVNEAISVTSKRFEVEADHQKQSAAKEVADLTAQRANLQALLDATILREISHLRWNCIFTKHNQALSKALCEAEQRDMNSTQQLSAARQQIADITDELKDTKAKSADLKVQLSAEADQRRKTEESLVNVKAELQDKTEQVLSDEHEAERLKAELKQAEAKMLNELKELQQQLAAEKQRTASAEKEHQQHCNELQSALAAEQRELAEEKEAGTAAADRAASLQVQLEAAGHAACTLQSQLTAVQQDLAAEQQRHQAAQQTVASLELELQATKQEQLAAEKQRHISTQQMCLLHCTEMQSALEAQQQVFAREKDAGMAAADRAASLQVQLEAAGRAACSLQSQLAAVQKDLAAEQQRHQAAQQTVATLEFQLQDAKQLADTLPAEVPNSHPHSAGIEVPSRRPQEHPQGADTPAGSLSPDHTMLLVQSRPANPVANDGSIVEGQSVEHMSISLVDPHVKLLAVEDGVTLGGSTPQPGSGSPNTAQGLESLSSPAPQQPVIAHASGDPSVTPANVDPAWTPTADADCLAPAVDGKSTMGGVASEPLANKHCTVQDNRTAVSPAAPAVPATHLVESAHAPEGSDVTPSMVDPVCTPTVDADSMAPTEKEQSTVGATASEIISNKPCTAQDSLKSKAPPAQLDAVAQAGPHPAPCESPASPQLVEEVRQLQQQLEALKLSHKVDKCARLEASIAPMQAAIQAAEEHAAAAEVQAATAEQRAAAAEAAAAAALEAAQLQVNPHSSHPATGLSTMRPQVTSITPGVAAR
ncbi:hypothetical protein ABBQ38_004964 [Trebouxia sp. C0009 RCD-2024]